MNAEDRINHPKHYTSHPSGVECIEIVEVMGFNLGNAIKYLWRAGLKSPDPVEGLKKAAWYVQREIERLTKVSAAAHEATSQANGIENHVNPNDPPAALGRDQHFGESARTTRLVPRCSQGEHRPRLGPAHAFAGTEDRSDRRKP